jgi:uncharacterized protein YpiB (UPF0302 family)
MDESANRRVTRVKSDAERKHLRPTLEYAFPLPDNGRFDDLVRAIEQLKWAPEIDRAE